MILLLQCLWEGFKTRYVVRTVPALFSLWSIGNILETFVLSRVWAPQHRWPEGYQRAHVDPRFLSSYCLTNKWCRSMSKGMYDESPLLSPYLGKFTCPLPDAPCCTETHNCTVVPCMLWSATLELCCLVQDILGIDPHVRRILGGWYNVARATSTSTLIGQHVVTRTTPIYIDRPICYPLVDPNVDICCAVCRRLRGPNMCWWDKMCSMPWYQYISGEQHVCNPMTLVYMGRQYVSYGNISPCSNTADQHISEAFGIVQEKAPFI